MRAFLIALGLVAAGAFATPSVEAQSGTRVVVERFRGPRGATSRRALVSDLEENGVAVISQGEVTTAREELGFGRRLEEAERVELARRLRASAFIEGRVVRSRRRWRLSLRVYNGRDGAELGRESWAGRTATSLSGVGRNGYSRLSEHLSQASAPEAAATTPDGEVPWWQREDAEHPNDEDEPLEEARPRDASTRYDAVRVSLLGGSLFRTMNTTVTIYSAHRGPTAVPRTDVHDETRSYQSGDIGHFELGAAIEVYPGAFDDAQTFPYAGLLLSYTNSAFNTTIGADRTTEERVAIGTDQNELFVGLRLRYRLGEARREPEVHLDAGWGMFNFDLNLAALERVHQDTIVPPMQHGYVHFAAGINYGVVPTYVTLGVELGGRIGTNIGAATRNVWGISTAPSNGLLLGANLRAEIPEIVQGAFAGLNVQYMMFETAFSGLPGCAVACVGDPDPWTDLSDWEPWPVNAVDGVYGGPNGPVTDHYVRLQLAVGFAYH